MYGNHRTLSAFLDLSALVEVVPKGFTDSHGIPRGAIIRGDPPGAPQQDAHVGKPQPPRMFWTFEKREPARGEGLGITQADTPVRSDGDGEGRPERGCSNSPGTLAGQARFPSRAQYCRAGNNSKVRPYKSHTDAVPRQYRTQPHGLACWPIRALTTKYALWASSTRAAPPASSLRHRPAGNQSSGRPFEGRGG
jgi:hypothetical protein